MNYAESVARLEAARARETATDIREDSRTLALLHGASSECAVVCFHGLTNSPAQFADFARQLYEHGDNVIVPCLPRHGSSNRMTDTIARLTRQELLEAIEDAIAVARGLGERVTVLGFSMGGTLAAWIGQHHHVDRIIAVSPFLGISALPRGCGALLRWTLATMPNVFLWWDPRVRERSEPEHAYPRYPTHALAAALSIGLATMRAARATPPAARRLIVIFHRKEPSCNRGEMRYLAALWKRTAGERATLVEWNDLPLMHDIIEPSVTGSCAPVVYPRLLSLLQAPP